MTNAPFSVCGSLIHWNIFQNFDMVMKNNYRDHVIHTSLIHTILHTNQGDTN